MLRTTLATGQCRRTSARALVLRNISVYPNFSSKTSSSRAFQLVHCCCSRMYRGRRSLPCALCGAVQYIHFFLSLWASANVTQVQRRSARSNYFSFTSEVLNSPKKLLRCATMHQLVVQAHSNATPNAVPTM
jgi:hypothetical protein